MLLFFALVIALLNRTAHFTNLVSISEYVQGYAGILRKIQRVSIPSTITRS